MQNSFGKRKILLQSMIYVTSFTNSCLIHYMGNGFKGTLQGNLSIHMEMGSSYYRDERMYQEGYTIRLLLLSLQDLQELGFMRQSITSLLLNPLQIASNPDGLINMRLTLSNLELCSWNNLNVKYVKRNQKVLQGYL